MLHFMTSETLIYNHLINLFINSTPLNMVIKYIKPTDFIYPHVVIMFRDTWIWNNITKLFSAMSYQNKLNGIPRPPYTYCTWVSFLTNNSWASCQIHKIGGAHAPGMPGTCSPSPQVSDPDMHHGTCVTHVPWCMPGSLTSGFLWNRRRGKTFPAFPAHAQPAILRIW